MRFTLHSRNKSSNSSDTDNSEAKQSLAMPTVSILSPVNNTKGDCPTGPTSSESSRENKRPSVAFDLSATPASSSPSASRHRHSRTSSVASSKSILSNASSITTATSTGTSCTGASSGPTTPSATSLSASSTPGTTDAKREARRLQKKKRAVPGRSEEEVNVDAYARLSIDSMKDLPPVPHSQFPKGSRRSRKSSRAPRLPKLNLGQNLQFEDGIFDFAEQSASPNSEFQKVHLDFSSVVFDQTMMDAKSPLEKLVAEQGSNELPDKTKSTGAVSMPHISLSAVTPAKDRVPVVDSLKMTEMWVSMLEGFVDSPKSASRPRQKKSGSATKQEPLVQPKEGSSNSSLSPYSSVRSGNSEVTLPLSPAPSSECLDPTFLGPSPRTSSLPSYRAPPSIPLPPSPALLESLPIHSEAKACNPFEASFEAATLNVQQRASMPPSLPRRGPPAPLSLVSASLKDVKEAIKSAEPILQSESYEPMTALVCHASPVREGQQEPAYANRFRSPPVSRTSPPLSPMGRARPVHRRNISACFSSCSSSSAAPESPGPSSSYTSRSRNDSLSSSGISYTSTSTVDTSFDFIDAKAIESPRIGYTDTDSSQDVSEIMTPLLESRAMFEAQDITPHAPARTFVTASETPRKSNGLAISPSLPLPTKGKAYCRIPKSPTMEIVMYGMAL